MLERRCFLSGLVALPLAPATDVRGAGARDPVHAAIVAHRRAYDAWEAEKAEATSAPDDPSDVRLAAADDLLEDLAAMVPQTTAGLRAYAKYFVAYAERDEDPATQHPALASIAAACRAVLPIGGDA